MRRIVGARSSFTSSSSSTDEGGGAACGEVEATRPAGAEDASGARENNEPKNGIKREEIPRELAPAAALAEGPKRAEKFPGEPRRAVELHAAARFIQIRTTSGGLCVALGRGKHLFCRKLAPQRQLMQLGGIGETDFHVLPGKDGMYPKE
ncbi:hypothetical protein QR680_011570 [Steinernema hermaphroditum]|uniref:Uncharacterized protein n=1 Tax=Steinernema hermaphroditum TaxID=289476 RepID=A0AA39LYX7_9BILA|nr:hypothetical protein QR680_011570 [Steinernema hermaphroditum]